MNLDDLLSRYFGTTRIEDAPPKAVLAGLERLHADLGLETVLSV